jgi:hypothetical protein
LLLRRRAYPRDLSCGRAYSTVCVALSPLKAKPFRLSGIIYSLGASAYRSSIFRTLKLHDHQQVIIVYANLQGGEWFRRQRLYGEAAMDDDLVLPKRQALYFLVASIAVILIAFAIYVATGHLEGSSGFAVSVVVFLVLIIGIAGVLALSFALAGIGSARDALGLPEGSIRAILAIGLLTVLVGTAAFFFTGLTKPDVGIGQSVKGLSQAEVDKLRSDFAIIATPTSDGKFDVTIYPRISQASQDMAKQAFTAVATALAAIIGFYFGSGATSSATKAAETAAQTRASTTAPGPTIEEQANKASALATGEAAKAAAALQSANAETAKLPTPTPEDRLRLAAVETANTAAQAASEGAKKFVAEAMAKMAEARTATGDTRLKAIDAATVALHQAEEKAREAGAHRTEAEKAKGEVLLHLPPPSRAG